MVGRMTFANCVRPVVLGISLASAVSVPSLASAQSSEISGSMAAHYDRGSTRNQAVPNVLSADEREHYRNLFRAIDREEWEKVQSLLNERKGVLHQIALAEYYTHANSPAVSAEQIADWFAQGLELPQAEQLGRLGERRGLEYLPAFPQAQGFSRQREAPKRILPRRIDDGTMSAQDSSAILDAIVNDDPANARAILQQVDPLLSPEARAEWRQRVAWSFYIENDDQNALALAETVSEGSGPWVAEGEWGGEPAASPLVREAPANAPPPASPAAQ